MCETKPVENETSENDPREDFFRRLSGTILMSNVESILEEYGIKIPDSNRTGDETKACLFGEAYFTVEDELVEMLKTRFGSLDKQHELMESSISWKPAMSNSNRKKILNRICQNIRVDEKLEASYEVLVDNFNDAIASIEEPIIDCNELYETHERKIVGWICNACDKQQDSLGDAFDNIFRHILHEHIGEIIPDFDKRSTVCF